MIKAQILSCGMRAGLSTLAGLAICLQTPLAAAQGLARDQSDQLVLGQDLEQSIQLEQRAQTTYDPYILGPGDGLEIELLDLPELSGRFSIGPDGTLYLPRLRSLYVEGLTVEDLRRHLTQKFSAYVLDPQVYVRPVVYRPVRIYVGGEVKRPGYYTLTGAQFTADRVTSTSLNQDSISYGLLEGIGQNTSSINDTSDATLFTSTPTV